MTYVDIHQAFSGLNDYYLHTVRISTDELVASLQRLGFKVFLINGSVITDRTSFFDEFARVLEFPCNFEKKWAVFHNCMTGFGIGSEYSNIAIVWNDVGKLLSSDIQTFTEAICNLYEDISTLSFDWITQHGEDASKQKQAEVFLVGTDERFPVIKAVK